MHKHDDNSTVISPFGRGEPGDGEAIRKSQFMESHGSNNFSFNNTQTILPAKI